MDKYEVIGLLGEGSFGRVYKANQVGSSTTVALKVISKRGRTGKEIKGLRRECEIQRHLHHPNIIQMLDAFETDNEIVVITEFAHKELTTILCKERFLSENRVQTIVWDLVSALYYLHSHRVLHRDLKPQNILLNSKNNAKLCDFGFARNMSTGTHVLTSIKGTPLYMAPELIEEHPYDHNADLWSLGCIIYELLVGAPPFCTTSILHLIRMIRHEQIQFPMFLSEGCISFLKGLLQKDPAKRVAWPEILKHPFIKGHVLILDDVPSKPLTRPMSVDTLQAKERQRKDCLSQKGHGKPPSDYNASESPTNQANGHVLEAKLSSISIEESHPISDSKCSPASSKGKESLKFEENFNICENSNPIENEEWVVFLQRTIEEVIAGEMGSISQASLANIIVSPLRNSNASSKVLSYVANTFSLPFVVPGTSGDILEQIRKTYLNIKLIPNLVYASKLMLKTRRVTSHVTNSPSDTEYDYDLLCEAPNEDLAAQEHIYVLICHLVHLDDDFLIQLCDSVVVLNMHSVFRDLLLLSKRRVRIVIDLLAILTHILRKFPEHSDLVTEIISNATDESADFVHLLRDSNSLLRERCCQFLHFFGKRCQQALAVEWNDTVRETLEALVYDSIEDVRNAAEIAIEGLKKLPFYDKIYHSDC